MWKKLLAIGIILAFGACGFKIYGQQNEIRQWRERAIKYQSENNELKKQVEAQNKGQKKKTAPINFSYSSETMDELERLDLENKIQDLELELSIERNQRELDKFNFETNRYDPSYAPY